MENLAVSMKLMVIGMVVTFIFLILMVYILGALEKFVAVLDKYFPPEAQDKTAHAKRIGGKAKIALAIAAARHHAK